MQKKKSTWSTILLVIIALCLLLVIIYLARRDKNSKPLINFRCQLLRTEVTNA